MGVLAIAVTICAACAQDGGSPPAEGTRAETPVGQAVQVQLDQARPQAATPAAGQTQASHAQHAAAPAGQPAASTAAAAPQLREMRIPSETALTLKLATAVASNTSQVEDTVRAALVKPLVIDGVTVVPAGAEVVGAVLEAVEAGRVKGRASVAFRFDRLRAWNESHQIRTERIAREAESTRGDDAKKVGIGAGAGAVIGAIAGGKKGAAVGGAIGAGTGTGVALATRGDEVVFAAGTTVTTRLEEPVSILVPID
jgi:hypothetical protein